MEIGVHGRRRLLCRGGRISRIGYSHINKISIIVCREIKNRKKYFELAQKTSKQKMF